MTSHSLPHAVIFDMDGLIFDTEVLYQQALLELAAERGYAAIDKAALKATVGLSWDATRELVQRLVVGLVDIDSLFDDWIARYDMLAEQRLPLKPGVTELLVILERLSIPRAIATGAYRAAARHHLRAHGLEGCFSAVVTKEDCAKGKPAPDPFLAAASRLGVDPRVCWALEDSINGVISAHAAGMKTIMVPDLVPPDEQAMARCYLVASSLSEVADLLSRID